MDFSKFLFGIVALLALRFGTANGSGIVTYADVSNSSASEVDVNAWTPRFDPWGDVKSTEQSFPSSDAREEFYEFTEENIEASKVVEWYALWTSQQSNTSAWQKNGEWAAFFKDHLGEPNFMCTLGNDGCLDSSTLVEIEQRYQNYPEYARRVYFTKHMYELFHAQSSTISDAYVKAQNALVDHVGEIVHAMELEPNPKKQVLCALIHELISTGVQIALTVVASAGELASGFGASGSETGQKFLKFNAEYLQPVILPLIKAGVVTYGDLQSGPLAGVGALQQILSSKLRERCTPMMPKAEKRGVQSMVPGDKQCNSTLIALDMFGLLPLGELGGLNRLIWTFANTPDADTMGPRRDSNPYDAMALDAGTGGDNLCDSFEGATSIDPDYNIAELKNALTNKFTLMQRILSQNFEMYYNGTMTPYGFSKTAEMFASTKWAGPGSVTKDLAKTAEWQDDMELQMAMQAASLMSAHDHSYIVCTRSKKAPEICAAAANAEAPCKQQQKGCLRTVFCPETATDPELICRAQKWYPAPKSNNGGHVTILPSAEKWPGLLADRFHLTRQKVLMSAWDFYKAYQNNHYDIDATWGTKNDEMSVKAGNFHLPVCFREGIEILDDEFPALCTNWKSHDWRNQETFSFMGAAFMGPSSRMFNDAPNKDSSSTLITNVLPRVINKRASSPVARYLGFCQQFIRWPDHSDKEDPIHLYRMHPGADASCEIVESYTQAMTEEQANMWFCDDGAPIHTVFDRERPYVTVDIPLAHCLKPHKSLCRKWMATHGKADYIALSPPIIDNSTDSEAASDNAAVSDVEDDGNLE